MLIHEFIIHQVNKQADQGASTLSLSPKSLSSSPALERFLEDLNRVYNSKPSKVFGAFINTGQDDNVANKAESLQNLLSSYLNKAIGFVELSQQAMQLLKHYIDQASKATGGYLLFVHYTLFGSDFLMISMLNNVSGVAVNTNLEIDPVDYIELNKLHLAVRIDLTDWQELESQEQRQDSKTSARYISMIRGKESHKLSEYFRKFIGSDESISSKQETSELFNAVSQFCEQKIENEEQKAQIKQKASEFCLEQADKGQNVVIRDFSNYAAEGVVDDFLDYVNSEQFQLSQEIAPNKTVIRRFNKLSGRNERISITINEEALGDSVIFDPEKETLTITDLPASLKAQLLNR